MTDMNQTSPEVLAAAQEANRNLADRLFNWAGIGTGVLAVYVGFALMIPWLWVGNEQAEAMRDYLKTECQPAEEGTYVCGDAKVAYDPIGAQHWESKGPRAWFYKHHPSVLDQISCRSYSHALPRLVIPSCRREAARVARENG